MFSLFIFIILSPHRIIRNVLYSTKIFGTDRVLKSQRYLYLSDIAAIDTDKISHHCSPERSLVITTLFSFCNV